MRIKSYFASAVETAIRQAQEELGPEAMLIESKPASPDMRAVGRFEVVFGVLDSTREQPQSRTAIARAAPAVREDLAEELKMLRGQITELRHMLQPSQQPASAAVELESLRTDLIAADLDPRIAGSLTDALETALESSAGTANRKEILRQALEHHLLTKIQTTHERHVDPAMRSVITFVGPPGAGKTTSLAKIAVQQCLAKRRSVRIISVDTERVGGHELLRSYSNVLGIGFVAASSLATLQEALNEGPEKACTLIDTQGFAPGDAGAANDTSKVLGRIPSLQVHLVLAASMKRADAAAYSDYFGMFKPTALLFTKLDETLSVGSILSETLRLGLPLSFFCAGQTVPEDIQNADPRMLFERLLQANAATAASAA